MPTKVIMPQMGESIFEGTITKWLKKVGDQVNRDEPLFEISTDKVDSEIPSPASGVLSEIAVPEGKTVQINTVVAVINGEGAAETKEAPKFEAGPAPKAAAAPPEAAAAEPPPAPEPPPREEPVEQKVTETRALRDVAREATAAQEGTPESEKAPAPPSPPSPPERKAPAPAVAPRDVRTSPLVRRLAREHGIDISEIRGSGLEGRITKQDIEDYIRQKEQPAAAAPSPAALQPAVPKRPTAAPPAAAPPPAPSLPPPEMPKFMGESEAVPMTNMRKAIAEHMVLSKHTSAHVNTIFEVDMTPIVHLREQHKAEFEKREGIKLTFTPFLVKALVDTVREFPVVNASVSGDNIIYKKPVNVGIAVALDTGLIVPVIRDAHLKSFTGIALAIHDVAERARTKRLKPDDVQNGTITITNPGSYGAVFGTPIISQPQVAILGVGGIEKRVVVVNDAIAIRSTVFLSLSFDHRVIDGAVADQFMARLKQRLQSWTTWMD
jgi:2-oxoglutarate dehydrogenase E2 component (dihydrolipoamide succinyltransferase)